MYNKFKATKANTQKVLHKINKQWVVVSIALFALIGGGVISTHTSANTSTTGTISVPSQETISSSSMSSSGSKYVTSQATRFHNQLIQKASKSASSNDSNAPQSSVTKNWGDATVKYSPDDTMTVSGSGSINIGTYSAPSLPFNNDKNDWKLKISQDNANIKMYDSKVSGLSYGFSKDDNPIWNHFQSMDLSGLDTSNLSDMSNMFNQDSNLVSLNLKGRFNTNNANNINEMFESDTSLSNLDLSNFNTNNVTNMSNLFYKDNNLNTLDLNNFNTEKVNDMSNMFSFDNNISQLNISSFDTHNVSDMSNMFDYDNNLQELDLGQNTNLNRNQNWDEAPIFFSHNHNVNNIKSVQAIKNGTQSPGAYYIDASKDVKRNSDEPNSNKPSLTSSEASYANQIKADINSISFYKNNPQIRSARIFAQNTGGNLESLVNSYEGATYPYEASNFGPDDYNPETLNQSYVNKINHGVSAVSSAESAIVSVASSASASLSTSATNSNTALDQSVTNSVENSMNASYANDINQLTNEINSLSSRPSTPTYYNNDDNSSVIASMSASESQHDANDDLEISKLENEVNSLENNSSQSRSTGKPKTHKSSSRNHSKRTKNNSVKHIKYLYNLTGKKIKRARTYLKHHNHSRHGTVRLRALIKYQKQYKTKLHKSSRKAQSKKRHGNKAKQHDKKIFKSHRH